MQHEHNTSYYMCVCFFYVYLYMYICVVVCMHIRVAVWRLYAAATLPCIQKGRHGGHHRERKENLTKRIDRDIYK